MFQLSNNSLTYKTLLQMGLRIALVILGVTFLSYWHTMSNLEEQIIEQLGKYIVQRGQTDSQLFKLAESNQANFKQEFLKRYQAMADHDPITEFNQLFQLLADGTTRMRPEYFHGLPQPNGFRIEGMLGFVGQHLTITPELRRRLIIGYEILKSYGPAWHNDFPNLYVVLPDNADVTYWPGTAWELEAPADYQMAEQEWHYLGKPEHNPERKTVWTGLYYDDVAKQWMVSCITPIDWKGTYLASVANDVLLTDLLENVINSHLEGTYNLLFREDGRLIVHPHYLKEIQEQNGKFEIAQSGNPHLINMFRLVKESSSTTQVIENRQHDEFLAVTRIAGPNWFLVTVYPKSLLTKFAWKIALFIFLVSFTSLVIEIIFLFLVLHKQVAKPLCDFVRVSEQITHGLFNGQELQELPTQRNDEIGELALSFHQMAKQLRESFETLALKNQELQRLDQLKDEFLANTSRELQTPLSGIKGLAESLIEGSAGELSNTVKAHLAMIVRSGKQLTTLVNDLLDFSMLKNQTLVLDLTNVGIREVVDLVITLSQPLVANKSLQLINAVDSQLPLALADEQRLQQVFHHLIENAIKFTNRGTVRMSAHVVDNFIEITVSDTGIGIPPHRLNHLFDSFSQVGSQPDGGLGLGLAITKQLIELHGGHIRVESTIGMGSSFIFTVPIYTEMRLEYLVASHRLKPLVPVEIDHRLKPLVPVQIDHRLKPLVPMETELEALANDPGLEALAGEGGTKFFQILIVDDDLVVLQLLHNYLSQQHYQVKQATSGPLALKILAEGFTPDAILLDVMMPQMTGYEVLQRIRKTWGVHELPILLLTSKRQVSEIIMGLQYGANDCLTKPVVKEELLTRLHTHLHLKELQAEALRVAKANEQRLRQFLEAMPIGVAVFEPTGQPYYFNYLAQHLFGKGVLPDVTLDQLPRVYQLYLAGTEELYPPQQLPCARALRGEGTVANDVEIRRPDHQSIPLETRSTSILDEQGQIIYALVSLQDMTEHQRVETERQHFTQELFQLNQAYQRFIPREFLQLLGKDSIVEIQLGDQIEQEMTVLFADIRGFTALSEDLTPADTFAFINSYLGQMEPIILEHHGVIDKYIGDAIMAVFPTCAEDAVNCAIAMLKQLTKYNQLLQKASFSPLQIGIGLNTGRLMLGTVGGENRMEGTVISDAVNLASRIQDLTKIYFTPLLITQQTYLKLVDPLQYHIRVIDAVKVKGKSEVVTIYEVYDADSNEKIALKDQTRDDFEVSFVLYHSGEFADAQPFFEQILATHPTDEVTQIYLERCRQILEMTIPSSVTILIVDDVPENLRFLFEILKSHQFRVLVAKSGESALTLLEHQQVHLILLDIMMPGMNGLEVCRRLKENRRTKEIPVIFITALSDTNDKIRGFQVGAVDYITKPFQQEEVLARVRVHLQNRYLRQQLVEKM